MNADCVNSFGDQSALAISFNPALLALSSSKSVLLLQGPVGPFFDRLANWLIDRGVTVNRIVFQAGDEHDCQVLSPIRYTALLSEWPSFLNETLTQLQIEHVVLFGQSRHYHSVVRQICEELGIAVIVMEEGYFRPGFATMELNGVNGYSSTLDRYRWEPNNHDAELSSAPENGSAFGKSIEPDVSPRHFQKMAWHASQHYVAMSQGRSRYPNYQHHKVDDPLWYARYWVWSWIKKLWFRWSDPPYQARLISGINPYFFVPLQHDGDAQITHHSCFGQNTDFIIRVMRSFCKFAPLDAFLVFRQHPFSRGGSGHARFINSLAKELNLRHRVFHLTEADTPLLAQHSAGVVLINSTVGLQALERGAPLMVMGEALYKKPQLTCCDELDHFWRNARKSDPETVRLFLLQMKNLTQVSVSLYAMRSEPILWDVL